MELTLEEKAKKYDYIYEMVEEIWNGKDGHDEEEFKKLDIAFQTLLILGITK